MHKLRLDVCVCAPVRVRVLKCVICNLLEHNILGEGSTNGKGPITLTGIQSDSGIIYCTKINKNAHKELLSLNISITSEIIEILKRKTLFEI